MKLLSLLTVFIILISFTSVASAENEVCAYYFYRPDCSSCKEVAPYLEQLETTYSNLKVEKYNIDETASAEILWSFMKYHGVEGDSLPLPIVIIDDQLYAGVNSVKTNLEEQIKTHPEGLACPVPEKVEKQEIPGFLVIIGAAIADAVNPCALAFLLLLLITIAGAAYTGRSKKVLFAGLAFSVAVFIMHLIMGLGLLKAIQFAGFTTYIKIIFGTIAVIVGLFNIKDFFRLGAFGFKTEVPEKWKLKVKTLINKVASVPGAFLVGLLVSLFLTPCTFGPYIAIIGALASSATFWEAFPLLILYNLVFIIPMIILTTVIYFGADARRIQNWRTANTRWLHLIAGLIILALGILLLFNII